MDMHNENIYDVNTDKYCMAMVMDVYLQFFFVEELGMDLGSSKIWQLAVL